MRLYINTLILFFTMVELHLPNPIRIRHGHVTGYGQLNVSDNDVRNYNSFPVSWDPQCTVRLQNDIHAW